MRDDHAALSATLGDRYLIVRELGRGGMGTVYLTRDNRLDRPVALKVLPPEFAVVPELRQRFLRETRLAAGFSHPNIVPVFAIEETDDVLAFAMGFVEGESLASRARARSRSAMPCACCRMSATRWPTRTDVAWCIATSSWLQTLRHCASVSRPLNRVRPDARTPPS